MSSDFFNGGIGPNGRDATEDLLKRMRVYVSNMLMNEFRCHRNKADEMAEWLDRKLRNDQ